MSPVPAPSRDGRRPEGARCGPSRRGSEPLPLSQVGEFGVARGLAWKLYLCICRGTCLDESPAERGARALVRGPLLPGRVLEVSTCLARFKEPAEVEGSSASSLLGTLRGASHPLSGTLPSVPAGRPDASFFFLLLSCELCSRPSPSGTRRPNSELLLGASGTTLSGGSLGSCVDEERSQLRELM